MKNCIKVLAVVVCAALVAIVTQPAAAGTLTHDDYDDFFVFSGSDAGGTGSAQMGFKLGYNSGTNTSTLIVDLLNTSPISLDDGTSVNTPSITGFGFEAEEPIPGLTNWTLTATTALSKNKKGVISPVSPVMGSMSSPSPWVLGSGGKNISLDFYPNTAKGNNGGLYNDALIPAGITPAGSVPWFFGKATLTMTFSGELAIYFGPETGDGTKKKKGQSDEYSPTVRMQSVGKKGEGSLWLEGTHVPVPSSLALTGMQVLVVSVGYGLWRRRRSAPQEG
jgi:hypothetical protein